MYTQNGNLNDSLLLVDLYTFINNEANGGSLFKYSNNKANIVKKDTSNQQYLSNSISGKKKDIINDFLKSKNHNLTYDLEYLGHRVSKVDTVHTDPNTGKKTFDKYDTLTGQRILNNFDGKTGNPILYDIDSLKSSIIEALENDKNVGPTSSSFFARNDALVIGFRYDEFNDEGMDDETFDINYENQQKYYKSLNKQLENELKNKLQIPVTIIEYDENSIKKHKL